MDAQAFQRLHPKTYLERFLNEGLRPDGREPSSWRNVSINAGSITTAEGSALARLGDTTVVCGIKAELTEPDLARPEHGFIVPNIDCSAICSPRFKSGPPGEEAQICSQRIANALSSSNMLPTTSLCIEPGKSAWVLYIDATCINYDGNLFDATLLAVVSALLNTRLPNPTYNPSTHLTTISRSRSLSPSPLASPLAIDHSRIPYGFTFGSFTSSSASASSSPPGPGAASTLLCDPSSFEEPLLESTISITLLPGGEICGATQTGGAGGVGVVGPDPSGVGVGGRDALMRCIDAATERLGVLKEAVEHAQSRSSTAL